MAADTVASMLADAIAENDALIAEDEHQRDTTVRLLMDDLETEQEILLDVADLMEARQCFDCGTYAVEGLSGNQNCLDFWCSRCEPYHRCHRDCY